MRSPKPRGHPASKMSPFLPKTSRFLFSWSGHLRDATVRRAVTSASGPATAPAVDAASHSRGARQAERGAPSARVPSRLSGRGSSIQDAYGSSCFGRGSGGRSGATCGEDPIPSGDSWSIAAARPRRKIAKTQPPAIRQPRRRKANGGVPTLASSPLRPVSPSPPPLPLPPPVDKGKHVAFRPGEGFPELGAGDDHNDGGGVQSPGGHLVSRTRPAELRRQERQRVGGPANAAEPGGAGDPIVTGIEGSVPDIIVERVPTATDPYSDATIERLLRRVNAKEQELQARWSHLSAFLRAANDFRTLVADCEQFVGLLTMRADQFRARARGTRRVQAHASAATEQREDNKGPVTVGKHHQVGPA